MTYWRNWRVECHRTARQCPCRSYLRRMRVSTACSLVSRGISTNSPRIALCHRQALLDTLLRLELDGLVDQLAAFPSL